MYLLPRWYLQNHGGLTTTEIATARRPIIHTMPIPGCENYNAKYFAEKKMSVLCNSLEEIVQKTKQLLKDTKYQAKMIENQKKNIARDSCDKITEIILNTRGAYERNSK